MNKGTSSSYGTIFWTWPKTPSTNIVIIEHLNVKMRSSSNSYQMFISLRFLMCLKILELEFGVKKIGAIRKSILLFCRLIHKMHTLWNECKVRYREIQILSNRIRIFVSTAQSKTHICSLNMGNFDGFLSS